MLHRALAHLSAALLAAAVVALLIAPVTAQEPTSGDTATSSLGLDLTAPTWEPVLDSGSWLPNLDNLHLAPKKTGAKKLDPDNPGDIILGVVGAFAALAFLWCIGIFKYQSPNSGSCFD